MFDKIFFEKVFSSQRMKKYFNSYQTEQQAIIHYQCNIELAESFYTNIAVFEVSLRNSINRELTTLFGRNDWYIHFATTPGLAKLNKYITQANKQIAGRKEYTTPSKIIGELTLGFWVSLFNAEYERILWKDLRRAFPYMPKASRKRKNVSTALNHLRNFRNRVFHHEPISWNLQQLTEIHNEMLTVISWINKDIPIWIDNFDRFEEVLKSVKNRLEKSGITGFSPFEK